MFSILLVLIYVAFISLGLPDGLLGAAWPSMYDKLGVPLSSAGIISMIIAGGTVISALMGERLNKTLKTGLVTLLSVALTAVALFGFSISTSFLQICLWAVPYGLGAGSVDSALNNYVALHYKSRHMSWLHCFWGVGCCIGPNIMSACLVSGKGWQRGYFLVSMLQFGLSILLLCAIPVWKKVDKQGESNSEESSEEKKIYGLRYTLSRKGVKGSMLTFFCYCSVETTVGLWAVSYLVMHRGVGPEQAAHFGALFYFGIMGGRFLNGFLTQKFSDQTMIRVGQVITFSGILLLFIPLGNTCSLVGLVLIGLGCAPIYPCMIHATPYKFGKGLSQAVIGVQMACAYVGSCFMPPVFGLLAQYIHISVFPIYLIIIWTLMTIVSEITNKRLKRII